MSQNGCPSDSEIYVGVGRPQGLGGIGENMRSATNPIFMTIEEELGRQRNRINKQRVINQASEIINADMLPDQPTTVRQKVELMAGSRELQQWIRDAENGVEQRQAALDEAIRSMSGATVHDASTWLNFTNAMSKLWVKKEALWDKWAILLNGTEGRSVKDNPLVASQELMKSKTTGALQRHLAYVEENVHKKAKPFADRVHMEIGEFMDGVGEYAVLRHIPEANAELLRTWDADLSVARAAGRFHEVSTLTNQIAELRQHIDSIDPPETLTSAGYTNGEAAQRIPKLLERMGLTEAEANSLGDLLTDWNVHIADERRASGLISPEVQARWPQFEHFVPLKSRIENTTGAPNVANIYNPGRYYSRRGSNSRPENAYRTLNQYARRASFEEGMQDLGSTMIAAMENAKIQNRDIGLRAYKFSEVSSALHDANEFRRHWAETLMNEDTGGGIVVDMPIRDADGNVTTTEKMLLTFDQNWSDKQNGLSGIELNQALMQNVKSLPGSGNISRLTSLYGQLNTRFTPGFAPPNSIRDVSERAVHIVARDYRATDGSVIKGSSIVGSFLSNVPSAMKLMVNWKRGALDMNSRDGQLIQSYVSNGLHQEYTRGMNNPRRSLDDIINGVRPEPQGFIETQLEQRNMRGVKDTISRFDANTRGKVLSKLDSWNDAWNNIAPLAHYKTLLEAGVESRAAAHGALELFDLYQSGTITPMLSTIFPYVKPTVQTIKAMSRTFGLAPNAQGKFQMNYRGLMAIGSTYAAISALLPFFKDSMGIDEDTGESRFDLMPIGELQRYMPIGLDDGSYAKLYLGFGPARFAATAAVGMDRMQRGLMTGEDFTREMLFAVAKEVSPANWPEFSMREQPLEWIEQAFAPTIAKPWLDIMANTNFRGGNITYARNDNTAKAYSGRLSTPAFYHRFAEDVYKSSGVDMAPEQWRALFDGYAVGPLRVLKGVILGDAGVPGVKDESLRAKGADSNATEELGPWLSALGGTMFYGRTANLNRNMFYDELNRYEARIRRENIKLTSDSYGSNKSKKEKFQRAQLSAAGWDTDEINEYLRLATYQGKIKQLNKEWKQNKLPERWFAEDDLSLLNADFEELAIQQSILYTEAVENLMRYSGTGL